MAKGQHGASRVEKKFHFLPSRDFRFFMLMLLGFFRPFLF